MLCSKLTYDRQKMDKTRDESYMPEIIGTTIRFIEERTLGRLRDDVIQQTSSWHSLENFVEMNHHLQTQCAMSIDADALVTAESCPTLFLYMQDNHELSVAILHASLMVKFPKSSRAPMEFRSSINNLKIASAIHMT